MNELTYEVVTPDGDTVEVMALSSSVDEQGYLSFFRREVPGAANGYIAVAGFAAGQWCYWTIIHDPG